MKEGSPLQHLLPWVDQRLYYVDGDDRVEMLQEWGRG